MNGLACKALLEDVVPWACVAITPERFCFAGIQIICLIRLCAFSEV